MKKKLISTLLIFALVICLSTLAFPGTTNFAHAEDYGGNTPIIDYGGNTPTTGNENPSQNDNSVASGTIAQEEEENGPGYFIRYFVWVERGRDEDGLRNDKIIMELIPVEEEDKEEYMRKLKAFSGWEVDEAALYSPADGFFTGQVQARLADFELEHYYGGKSTIEIGLIDEAYNATEAPVYYEHKALADSSINYTLVLRVGELKLEVAEQFTKADFTFAAKPDGSGSWEIILRDADGNDIEYKLV